MRRRRSIRRCTRDLLHCRAAWFSEIIGLHDQEQGLNEL